jgi:hypothetical protein
MSTTLKLLSELDPISVYASGIAIAAVISAFAISFMTISKARFNFRAILQMVGTLIAIIPIIMFLTTITDFDPLKLITIVGSISMVIMALSGSIKLISTSNVANASSTIVMFAIVVGALVVLMAALTELSKMAISDYSNLMKLSVSMLALVPILAAMSTITVLMSRFNVTLTGTASFAIITGILIALMGVFAAIASFGNVEGTIALIDNIGEGL